MLSLKSQVIVLKSFRTKRLKNHYLEVVNASSLQGSSVKEALSVQLSDKVLVTIFKLKKKHITAVNSNGF